MKRIALACVAAALTGCALPSLKTGLHQAVDSGDVSRIAIELHEVNRDVVSSALADTEIKRQAVELFSEHYKNKFFENPNQRLANLINFDQNCLRMIRQKCSDSSRSDILSFERRLKDQEAAKKKSAAAARQAQAMRDLESGKRKPETWAGASMLYRPMPGNGLMSSPSLSGGDGKHYIVEAYLTSQSGSNYTFWWADSPLGAYGGMRQSGAIFTSPAFVEQGVGFNMQVIIIGRYVGNRTIPLVLGGSAIVPVFADAHIYKWSRY